MTPEDELHYIFHFFVASVLGSLEDGSYIHWVPETCGVRNEIHSSWFSLFSDVNHEMDVEFAMGAHPRYTGHIPKVHCHERAVVFQVKLIFEHFLSSLFTSFLQAFF